MGKEDTELQVAEKKVGTVKAAIEAVKAELITHTTAMTEQSSFVFPSLLETDARAEMGALIRKFSTYLYTTKFSPPAEEKKEEATEKKDDATEATEKKDGEAKMDES